MKTGYMWPLMPLPRIITEPGKYLTRSGDLVVVYSIGSVLEFTCNGSYPDGIREYWHVSGRLYANVKTSNDIVEKI